MFRMHRLPIAQKLLLIMLLTTMSVVLMLSLTIFLQRAFSEQKALKQQLSSLAEVIASRSTGALSFYDQQAATSNLSALEPTSSISYAGLRDQQGHLFASYTRPPNKVSETPPYFADTSSVMEPYQELFARRMVIVKPVILDNEQIGDIFLVASLLEFRDDMLNYSLVMLMIIAGAFVVALLLSAKLNQIISSPIKNLHDAMQSVTIDQDYSIRAQTLNEDELGALVNGFNQMLQQVQLRDSELETYRHNLEGQVSLRSEALLEANKQRIQWLETMAGFLRHELKNTTVGVKTSLDLIEKRQQTGKPIEIYLERARKSMAFMNSLLLSVSDASSLEAAIYKETLVPLDLSALITSRVAEYQVMYPDTLIACNTTPNICIEGQQARLLQMLDKLFSNAREHAETNSKIIISLTSREHECQLSVTNKGIPLPEDKDKIFELFISMRDQKHKNTDNFGLGLYIVKLIAESHQGQVQANSPEQFEGAEFVVSLPLILNKSVDR